MSSPAAKISLSRARVLSSRSRFASGSCSFLAVHSHGQTRTGRGRRDGGFAPRADGINFEGFPYVIARKAGFDTSKGILGFTPFAELFVGRTAMGGFVVGTQSLGFNPAIYMQLTIDFITPDDITSGLIKAAVFGFIIAIMGCYNGYHSAGGAQGVGRATTNAVVSASILILSANYLMTSLLFSS